MPQDLPATHGEAVAVPPDPPMGLLLELTHRCPLQCPYCSNPLRLERAADELPTGTWCDVLDQAAALGVLQAHFSGGEPMARRDLVALVRHAAGRGLYSNLITSAVLLDAPALAALADAGLDHVQISLQDVAAAGGDRIANYAGAHAKKLAAARLVREAGLALTLNFVVHRHNIDRVPAMIELGEALGAGRIEIANVQYYGWGLRNRAALLPTRAGLDAATAAVFAGRARLAGQMVIDYVIPDYYAIEPKGCMGGWGRRFLNVSPAGRVLPCHAAETLPGFAWPSVRTATLAEIWYGAEAFARYRGTAWMPQPCRSCDRREIDWGGCRCQAFALTGEAGRTDPACARSPDHAVMAAAACEAEAPPPPFVYRRIGG
ncbi:MAG: pyrroloquinoline quinone biosynthesis protein PqqE [Rhodospirillales bacterium]|nr:pyrroloquinoline quinone biosynthesis protein PqqE [Rhodospirillales bacterium]